MKTSELIYQLEEIRSIHGDLLVCVQGTKHNLLYSPKLVCFLPKYELLTIITDQLEENPWIEVEEPDWDMVMRKP